MDMALEIIQAEYDRKYARLPVEGLESLSQDSQGTNFAKLVCMLSMLITLHSLHPLEPAYQHIQQPSCPCRSDGWGAAG